MSPGERETSAAKRTALLSDAAKEGQTVQHDGKTFTTIREGLAHILVPENARTELDPKRGKDADDTVAQSVFYNPIQQFNRDLSVLAIRAFAEDLVALRRAEAEKKAARARNRRPKRGTKRKADGNAITEAESTSKKTRSDDVTPGAAEIAEPDAPIDLAESALPQEQAGSHEMPMEVDHEPEIEPGKVAPADHTVSEAQEERPQEPQPERKISFKILDALSATGLRALRYAHEIPFVTKVTANDLSKQATQSIQANVVHNKLEDKITAVTGNATAHMYGFVSHPAQADRDDKYDVIDLDPYGTAATFLDAAVQAVNDGGLLCVTCTDAGVWASCGYPEKCYSLYGGTPIKGLHSHEGGLRLILHSIATAAARYGMAIEPLLSLSIDYYARVFVRIYRSPAEVKFLAGKTMVVYSCDGGCGAWKPQLLARNQRMTAKNGAILYKHGLAQAPTGSPLCEHCGTKTHVSRRLADWQHRVMLTTIQMNGPMYGGPLHNPAFIETILSYLPELDTATYATLPRIEGMLTTALEETTISGDPNAPAASNSTDIKEGRLIPKLDPAEVDAHPFYFTPSALARVLRCQAPPEAELKGALRHAGYKATRSHAKPGVIRTDAPWSFIWTMMREWVRQKAPIKEDAIKKGTPGWGIMHGTSSEAIAYTDKSQPPSLQTHTKQQQQQPESTSAAPPQPKSTESEIQVAGEGEGDDSVHINGAVPTGPSPSHHPKIVFDAKLGKQDPANPNASVKRLVRYQTNPRANWGPMNRAKTGGALTAVARKEGDDVRMAN